MSKVCATEQVVSQKTPAQVTTIMPAGRSAVSALAPITSSQAAKIAATAKLAKKRGPDADQFQPGFLMAEEKQIFESKPKTKQNFAAHFTTWKEIFG